LLGAGVVSPAVAPWGLFSPTPAEPSPESVAPTPAPPIAPSAEPAAVVRTDAPIRIDGRLDEASWADAPPVSGFFETYPGNVATPAVATEARFLHDGRSVYIGVRARDPEPGAIRSSLVRRDQVSSDQDYIEILIDSQGQRHTAVAFRTNAHGIATDAQFNEDTQARDFSPDLDFDVKSAIDAEGWTAELRIPLSTLRYRAGEAQSWTFVVYRNRPREVTATIASIPAPRGVNCTLCLAGELTGIAAEKPGSPLHVTPYVSHTTRDGEGARADTGLRADETHAGVDLKWQPSPETIVDLTIEPDFSQVEADALQLSANTLFALSSAEKRPFFLEGTDLLSTPIRATYTRAFANPEAGIRLTRRGEKRDYTALVLREAAGDRILEPGAIFSRSGDLDSESTVLLARHELHGTKATLGTLASGRHFDDGGRNVVLGADVVWTPSAADRITAQGLWSQTRNPDRPDLVPAWSGQSLDGAAGIVSWLHTEDTWNGSLSYTAYSRGFRAWNGFVSQVGVSRVSASAGLRFYPANPVIVRVSPTVSFTRSEEIGGAELSRSAVAGLLVELARDTRLTLSWSPDAKSTGLAGTRSANTMSLGLSTTPAPWMPGLSVSGSRGDGFDARTGEPGDSTTWSVSVPLRLFGQLEVSASAAHQSLKWRQPDASGAPLFDETNKQVNAVWHLSDKLYVQAAHQSARLKRRAPDDALSAELRSTNELSTALLSYQTNWQTRYFIGFRRSSSRVDQATVQERNGTEVFVKFAHVFSMF
jgi:hypothetical protein